VKAGYLIFLVRFHPDWDRKRQVEVLIKYRWFVMHPKKYIQPSDVGKEGEGVGSPPWYRGKGWNLSLKNYQNYFEFSRYMWPSD